MPLCVFCSLCLLRLIKQNFKHSEDELHGPPVVALKDFSFYFTLDIEFLTQFLNKIVLINLYLHLIKICTTGCERN